MKYILITLTGILAFSMLKAQPGGWQVNSSDYEYSMTISAVVEFEGTYYGAENDYLAAFVNDTCRGVAQASYIEAYDRYMFFLTVFSNDYQGEQIHFKYYRASVEDSITGFQNETFKDATNMGTASNPYIVSDQVQENEYDVTFIVNDGTNPLENANVNIDGETLITNSNGKALTQLPDGNYEYTIGAEGYESVTDSITVSDTAVSETVSLSVMTGLEQEVEFNTEVYPNPAKNYLVVSSPGMSAIDIVNLQGQVVFQQENCSNVERLSLSGMEPGIYLLLVKNEAGKVQKTKLMIY